MTKTTSKKIEFYRDSRRPQGWGGFFLAIWVAMHIGGAVPLWIIAIGALTTMAIVAAVIIKFRPKQLAASWDGQALLEKRFILPPSYHKLDSPPKLIRYEDDIAAVQFQDNQRLVEVYVIYDDDLEQQLADSEIEIVDDRD
ncbi:MAG: hypothetical protein ACQEQ8_05795 [Pseudomonadota bacterium]